MGCPPCPAPHGSVSPGPLHPARSAGAQPCPATPRAAPCSPHPRARAVPPSKASPPEPEAEAKARAHTLLKAVPAPAAGPGASTAPHGPARTSGGLGGPRTPGPGAAAWCGPGPEAGRAPQLHGATGASPRGPRPSHNVLLLPLPRRPTPRASCSRRLPMPPVPTGLGAAERRPSVWL